MARATSEPRLDSFVVQPDGRRTAYAEFGPADGRPVVLFHGMPGSRLLCPDLDATEAAGVRLVSPDRPGYGGSDPRPGLSLASWADDFAHLASELALGPCPVLGWSGGAAYAMAVAHHRPELVTRVGLLAGAGPVDRVPGAWDAMVESDRALMQAVRDKVENAYQDVLEDARGFTDDPAAAFGEILSREDGDFRGRPDLGPAMLAMFHEACRQGPVGPADDEIAQIASPWGFGVESVTCPVEIWWGEQDALVRREDAEYFAATLPDSRLHVVPDAGHAVPAGHWAEILASVLT